MIKFKKILSNVLVASLLLGSIPWTTNVHAAEPNIALNKSVTTSSVRPARSELVGGLAVDGIDDDEKSRWSSKMATGLGENEGPSEDGTKDQWITVDLKNTYDLSKIYISWEGAYAKSYTIQTSLDGETFENIYVNNDSQGGKQTITDSSFVKDTETRYVRINCVEPFNARWGYSIYEIVINGTQTDNENLALNKNVTFSGVEGGKTGDNWTYPQFVGEKAVDGDTATRWSADKTDSQWIIVDLGKVNDLSQVNVNFFREPMEYSVAISKDGNEYTTVLDVKDNPLINIENIREIVFDTQEVRYIKVNQTKMFTADNGKQYGGSILEIEAYKFASASSEAETSRDALARLEAEELVLPESNGEISFPESITNDFDVEIYGSDYKSIISLDGIFHQPLVSKDVHLMYKVTNKKDVEDVAISSNDITVHVPGKYADNGKNAAPQVIPTLQEWYGTEGQYILNKDSKILYNDESLKTQAMLLSEYLDKLVGLNVAVENGNEPVEGDIYLSLVDDADITVLGDEGYVMTVDDYVQIDSSDVKGAFYGGVSIVQALYLNADELAVNKGIARDYPKYEVRSIALDIARTQIEIDYIKEITEILPFFKVNEIVMHINDDRGDQISNKDIGSAENIQQARDLSSYRIENDLGIGNHAYQISKQDYIDYQLEAAKYGVSVVTELDTPAHSAVFSLIPEMKDNMYDVRHLKVLSDSSTSVENATLHQPTIDFIDRVTEELIGEYPGDAVIQTPIFHFGTDEYNAAPIYSEVMQQYINHYTDFIQDRGYEARAWASTDGAYGFHGYITPQNKEVTYYLWAPYWADVKKTVANGNPIINCSGSSLYIVPGGNNNYHNYLDMKNLYDNWSVNDITTTRGSGGAVLPISHPQLKGASIVLWNDDGFLKDGISDYDLYDRMKHGIAIISERTWYGEKTENQSFEDFEERYTYLTKTGPTDTSNPARYVASKNETIASLDFETIENNKVIDASGNEYHGILSDSQTVKGKTGNAFVLDGSSYIKMPFDTVGFPNTVSIDIFVDESTGNEAALFTGKDGVINLNQKNSAGEYTGKLGYERDGYTYIFDYEIETEKWLNILITGDKNGTRLYVDGDYVGNGKRTEYGKYATKNLSTTMILPTEKIGEGIVGKIDNLVIMNTEIPGPENIAPQANEVVASNIFDSRYTGEKAVDGSYNTRWATTDGITTATLELKFDKEVTVDATRIVEFKSARNGINNYNIEYWDGEKWIVAYTHNVSDLEKIAVPGVSVGYEFGGNFEKFTASRIRLNITGATNPTIYEFELYYNGRETSNVNKDALERAINFADQCIKEDYTEQTYTSLLEALEYAKEIYNSDYLTQEEVDKAAETLQAAIDNLVREYVVTVNGVEVARGVYNTKVTVEAPVVEGQEFTGWLLNGKLVSTKESYTFYISDDMELVPCYEEVEVKAEAMLTNVIVTKRADTKSDIKFVVQLVVPDGYDIEEAGLVWSNKGNAYNNEELLDIANYGTDSGVKLTKISKISNTWQYSVTIKGVPTTVECVPGRAYAKLVKAGEEAKTVQSAVEAGYIK